MTCKNLKVVEGLNAYNAHILTKEKEKENFKDVMGDFFKIIYDDNP